MIFDICGLLQDVIEEAASLKADNEGLQSLEEERVAQETAAEQEAFERERSLLRQKEDETAEESRVLTEQVQRELQRQEKVRLARRPLKPDPASTTEVLQDAVTFEQPMTTRDVKDYTSFTFRSVWGKSVILKTKDKKITIVNPLTDEDILVPRLLLKDIFLTEKTSESAKFKREMRSIEELLESSKIHRHSNVVDLLGYKIHRSLSAPDGGSGSAAFWELSILSEYANKGSLLELLEISGPLGAQKVRSWIHQLFDALEFFDQNGYIHPAVHSGNVLLFRSQSGAINVKLSDGYGTALKALVMQEKAQIGFTASETPFWTAPELSQKNPSRSAKTCIWDLGVIILQMVFGNDVTKMYTSPTNCIEGNDLSMHFEDILEKMFQSEPGKRPKAFDLTSFKFIHDDREPIFNAESTTAPSTPYRRPRHDSSFFQPATSRYQLEWEESGRLGKGGFGEVVKARNRMDGAFYAIKKVICESNEALQTMLAEAKHLARLNHPFIVRYFNAWEEKDPKSLANIRRGSRASSEEAIPSFDDDLIGQVSMGHDFMSGDWRNVGIQFSDEEEDLDGTDKREDETSNGWSSSEVGNAADAANSPVRPIRPRESHILQALPPEKSTLYIQMEYCENRTLRDLVQRDLYSNIDEVWRFFRQILDGLDHIHSKQMVHRDLKPDNIFISKGNNARIGDFGLATTGHFNAAPHGSASLIAGPETRSIGTMFYVAPELGSRGSGLYTSQADMYSLGIIFFEMCYPLGTFMERDKELRNLRQRDHKLPILFENSELAIQGQIITRLLSHTQKERPSAIELLNSGQVPEPIEDERIHRYILGISDADSPGYHKLISTLFSQPVTKAQDIAWNNPLLFAGMADSLLAMSVKDKIVSIFRRHGALETSRQDIFPVSEHYFGAATAKYLDPSGIPLQLPYDLSMPFARSLARGKLDFEKLYTFGDVYRRSTEGSEPSKIQEVDFDIVSHNSSDLALKEAEVIKVLDEILSSFPAFRPKVMSILINHSDLLDMILNYCRIKTEQHVKVKAVLSELNLGKNDWARVRSKLRSDSINIPATSLDDLVRFDFRDDFDSARTRLESIFENTPHLDRIAQIFARIGAVMAYLTRFKVKSKVLICPLSNNSERLYRGSILIQCMHNSQKKLVAVGGRYDSLIGDFLEKSSPSQARAVGFRLNLVDILNAVTNESKKHVNTRFLKGVPHDPISGALHPRCDVLVTSFDADILRSNGIELVQELWGNGISAELTRDFASMEELNIAHQNDSHSWVVTVRHDSSAVGQRSIKVRNVIKKEDTSVRATELVGWLKSEIRERSHREGSTEPGGLKLRKEIGAGELSVPAAESRDIEVRVLTSQHRGKKTNRHQIVDAAASKTRELVESFLSTAPVLAVETSDDILEYMRDTRLSEPESWRALAQSAPLQDRKYLQQVQEELQAMADAGSRGAFVFNHRTRGCIYYDLGRK